MNRVADNRLRLVLMYLAILVPPVIYGAVQTLSANVNSPLDWVSSAFKPRAAYDSFSASFGPGDAVVVSWDGCTLDQPRLDSLVQLLRTSPAFFDGHNRWLFHRVVCGREIVQQLSHGPTPLPLDAAIQRLRGTLVGPDGRTTCLVVTFTPAGLKQREAVVARIKSSIETICDVPQAKQHLGGPVIDGLSVDMASKSALDRLALPSALVVLMAACWCLRSVTMGLLVFGLSTFAQAATLALVHYCGETMSALLIVLPPLIQVLAVAGGIHLANYYFEALAEHGAEGAPAEALRRGWLPCVLSFGTTAVGMGSLMLSKVTPIRLFGAFSAAGVLLTAGLLLSVLPALLAWWPISNPRSKKRDHETDRLSNSGGGRAMAEWIGRRRGLIIVGSVALMITTGIGIRDLRSSVRIETLFGPASTVVGDYAWLEKHVGPLVPIEVVLTFDSNCPLPMEDRVTLLWRLAGAARQIDQVGGTMSILNLLPSFPARASLPPQTYGAVLHNMLVAARPSFESAGWLVVGDGSEQWRLSVFVSALGDVDYGAFLARLRGQLDPVLYDQAQVPLPGVSARFTGIMPLVHEIQRQLMHDLFYSFLSAFAVIALVMTVAQAGVLAGLVLMIPNIFPTLVVFGMMGWLRMPVDIGTVMTASIALGIAVDDTLHYITFFQRGLSLRMSRDEAVRWAYAHCGPAMAQTSIVCGLGLAVFAWNDFVPTERFAWVMVALIALALAGDLLLLPALLLSPAGRLFTADVRAVPHGVPRRQYIPPASSRQQPGVEWVPMSHIGARR